MIEKLEVKNIEDINVTFKSIPAGDKHLLYCEEFQISTIAGNIDQGFQQLEMMAIIKLRTFDNYGLTPDKWMVSKEI